MALSFYVMVGFLRSDRRSNEAAMKYLLLGAFSSGFLAYGFSLLYGLSGSTKLDVIAQAVAQRSPPDPLCLLAMITTSVGLFFKISVVPFHMWAPDAYEGAPTPITAYVSVASKAASFAFLMRIFLVPLLSMREICIPVLGVIALLTMTLGNVAALTQNNLKRLLAYSSISHAGYMLLGLVAGNELGLQGIAMYLLVYMFMNFGANFADRDAAPDPSRTTPTLRRRWRSPSYRRTSRAQRARRAVSRTGPNEASSPSARPGGFRPRSTPRPRPASPRAFRPRA
jgi:NADH-quinone oxidoreductase subunit N